jgi:biopolymer transport protein ExbD
VRLSVDAEGKLLTGTNHRGRRRSCPTRLQAEAAKNPQPDLHIRGDKDVRYERVAQAMASRPAGGLRKIGFITEHPLKAPTCSRAINQSPLSIRD